MQTILVVEDETSIAEMLTLLLELEGYQVRQARNGQLALDLLAGLDPDLILCDVMMPLIGGPAFVVALRRIARFADVPVVLMSAGLDEIAGMDGMINDYLRKPFKIDLLLATVRRLLPPTAATGERVR